MTGNSNFSSFYKGDRLEVMNRVFSANTVDLLFTDLPYGTTKCKWDSCIDLDKWWEQVNRILKPDGVVVLTAQTPFDKVLGCSNLTMLRYEWIIEKTNATGHLNAKKCPMKAHENVLVFYKKLPTYNPQKTTGHPRKTAKTGKTYKSECYGKESAKPDYDSTERYPRSVLTFKWDTQKSRLHSTQKPETLGKYMVKTYSNEGDLVVDTCMGSGALLLPAIALGRSVIGIDNGKCEKEDSKYFGWDWANVVSERVKERICPATP